MKVRNRMDKTCGTCKNLRTVLNPGLGYKVEYLCRLTNKVVDLEENREDCTSHIDKQENT